MGLIPKLSVKGAKGVLFSEPVLAVGSAMIFGTLAASKLTELVGNIPFLQNHVVFGLMLISVIILIVAVKMKSGVLRAIVIGFAGGSFFIGLLQVSAVSNLLAKLPVRS